MFTRFFTTVLSVTITLITTAATDAAPAQIAVVPSHGRVGGVEYLDLDNSWTSGGPGNKHGSQMLVNTALASRVSFDAETTGFAPA